MTELTVPRTTDARTPRAIARAAAERVGLPAGWWGMLMLIASEGALMGSFVGTYWYLRLRAPHWPPAGVPEPKVVVPMAMAGVLLATSIPMRLASTAVRAGRLAATRLWLLLAFVVQAGYLAYELHDYMGELHRIDMTRNAYTSIYYLLVGADHGHVFIGLLLDIWLLLKLAGGLTMYRLNATIAIAWYWYFANVLTVIVIGTLTLVHVV